VEFLADSLTTSLLFALLAAVVSGVLFGFAGFGAGLIMSPLFAVIFNPTDAIAIVTLTSTTAAILLWPQIKQRVQIQEALPVALCGALTIPFGTYILLAIDADLMRRGIGGIVLFFALIMLTGWTYRGPRGTLAGGLTGLMSGVVAGSAATSGPIYSLYLLSASADAKVTRANILFVSTIFPISTIVSMAAQGAIGSQTFIRFALILFPYALGIWVGTRIFTRSSDQLYRRIALWFIFVVGLFAVMI
tara:strand:+ start:2387 stop:3127 length:741 start_codon:yes stop_codon:yes gene_type:complete